MVDEVTEKPLELGRGRPFLSSRALQPEEESCCRSAAGAAGPSHIGQPHIVGSSGGRTLAPSFGPEPRNALQGPALTEEWHAQVYARDSSIGRAEFRRDAICHPVVRVVERAAIPSVETSGL